MADKILEKIRDSKYNLFRYTKKGNLPGIKGQVEKLGHPYWVDDKGRNILDHIPPSVDNYIFLLSPSGINYNPFWGSFVFNVIVDEFNQALRAGRSRLVNIISQIKGDDLSHLFIESLINSQGGFVDYDDMLQRIVARLIRNPDDKQAWIEPFKKAVRWGSFNKLLETAETNTMLFDLILKHVDKLNPRTRSEWIETLFNKAVMNNKPELVSIMIQKYGVTPDSFSNMPLSLAQLYDFLLTQDVRSADSRFLAMVKLLIQSGRMTLTPKIFTEIQKVSPELATSLFFTDLERLQESYDKVSARPEMTYWEEICSDLQSNYGLMYLRELIEKLRLTDQVSDPTNKAEVCQVLLQDFRTWMDEPQEILQPDLKCDNEPIVEENYQMLQPKDVVVFQEGENRYCLSFREIDQLAQPINPYTRVPLPERVMTAFQEWKSQPQDPREVIHQTRVIPAGFIAANQQRLKLILDMIDRAFPYFPRDEVVKMSFDNLMNFITWSRIHSMWFANDYDRDYYLGSDKMWGEFQQLTRDRAPEERQLFALLLLFSRIEPQYYDRMGIILREYFEVHARSNDMRDRIVDFRNRMETTPEIAEGDENEATARGETEIAEGAENEIAEGDENEIAEGDENELDELDEAYNLTPRRLEFGDDFSEGEENALAEGAENAIDEIDENAIDEIDENAIDEIDENEIDEIDENAIDEIDENEIDEIDENEIAEGDENEISEGDENETYEEGDIDMNEE